MDIGHSNIVVGDFTSVKLWGEIALHALFKNRKIVLGNISACTCVTIPSSYGPDPYSPLRNANVSLIFKIPKGDKGLGVCIFN